ncbi:phytoene/squalene synthase family protein [Metabacillus iocasae]|uniref:Phytoene synthase n=1 Tax=Priestia iocasae TaxID=2291674 RepID=A0ABS2QT29_9BACI|nr:phytoene/squalene synthase family protein [Metabacillus iocasae]MBM7702625.1 phytoene synthase [Metabacillus iocasae]
MANLLDDAYRYCEQIIATHSKTFYKAFSLLPHEKRKAVWAVYAFCRKVDDIVDEGLNPIAELEAFEKQFEDFKKKAVHLEDPMWVALHDVFIRFDMNVKAFDDMIKGQRMDLTKKEYDTIHEVKYYSYHVASTVGLMLLPILAPEHHKMLEEDAIALGIAMQLTNILRDVGEDLQRERIYLPKELMNHYGYTREMMQEKVVNKPFVQLWEHLAQEAEGLYEKGLSTLHYYPLSSRMPLKGAAYLYRAILDKIRKEEYQVFDTKHYVTNEQKQQIIASI